MLAGGDGGENHYVCPEVDLSCTLDIREGRHPVVEQAQKDSLFVPNDTFLNDADDRVAIVTGPNMAGKSTYMRQTALIVLMAQMGSFVPAKSAVIGMTRNMAMQFAAEGIRVNAVCPGGTKTPMIEAMNDPDQMLPCDKEFARITGRHFNTKLPMCTAEEQANAILFLASDEASGITGQYLVVDHGGWI